jgi:PAS domain S-box-containing protein
LGHHVAEFHADSDGVRTLLDQIVNGEPVTEREATLVRRDGAPQKVLLYANAKVENGEFQGARCFTFPHPDDLRPEISDVGALTDQSVESRQLELSVEERSEMYRELDDFFENAPVSLHMVGGDGLVKRANKSEFKAMGYSPEAYIGEHIARFHADQQVIDGMLEDLVGGTPLINFSATLFHKDGSRLPVIIYSNSRMRDGSFVNTRCFTVPVPRARRATAGSEVTFAWPRNEDFGFTVAGRQEPSAKPNPMTLALKYIASRKRPEESLGFLARTSQVLGSTKPFRAMLDEAVALSVPYLADFASVDQSRHHLAHAAIATFDARVKGILRCLNDDIPNARFNVASVLRKGKTEACFELKTAGAAAAQLLEMGIQSLIMVPLMVRGQHLGVLTLLRENRPSGRDFGLADCALAEELARRISFAVEIERLSGRS